MGLKSVPENQEDLDTATATLKSDTDEVVDGVESCIKKVSDVELPSIQERIGEQLFSAVFPMAGFYFGFRDIQWLIANQPAVAEKLSAAKEGAESIALQIVQLLSPGNPFALKAIAEGWDDVHSFLTGTISPISPHSFYATETWTDRMGVKYSRVPDKQLAALNAVIPQVASLRDFVRDHADTLISHWWKLCKTIALFVIEALPLAAKFISANPLKWADIAEPIAECVSHVLKTVTEVADAIFEFTMTSNAQIEGVKEALSDKTGTDFGSWPSAALG